MRLYYIERDGQVEQTDDVMEWGRRDFRVALSDARGLRVSTVFLGVDHRYDGPPLLYETMIFSDGEEHPLNLYCKRYTTREQAEAGHDAIVAKIEAGDIEGLLS